MKKSKKIVILTGSPRKTGNSIAMAEAFTKEAEKKGHSVTRFDAADMTIKGCTACETCFNR
ncbi:flavodoxin family protein [Lacrimispora sphenoides]|uniref:flavodoxin family protein n=1 Tax=Lacrimispora sphenoides TaxID=29370 RepID=UPI0026A6737E|nr:NAD(P)H-dependent oxidoreductase [Lacrimispora sphenoides]